MFNALTRTEERLLDDGFDDEGLWSRGPGIVLLGKDNGRGKNMLPFLTSGHCEMPEG